jgi:hypothetical protein
MINCPNYYYLIQDMSIFIPKNNKPYIWYVQLWFFCSHSCFIVDRNLCSLILDIPFSE